MTWTSAVGRYCGVILYKIVDGLALTRISPNMLTFVGLVINVVAANDQGTPNEGATPAIIVIQGSNKTTLDKTMDGKKLASGNYLLAAVAEGKTASVLFKVQ